MEHIDRFTSAFLHELHDQRMPLLLIPKQSLALDLSGDDEPEVSLVVKSLSFLDSSTRLSYVRVLMIVALVAELLASKLIHRVRYKAFSHLLLQSEEDHVAERCLLQS